MKVPLLDLKLQYQSIKPEIDAAVARVLEHTQFIMGPEVKSLESKLAEYCQCKYAVGVSSGTDALLIALHGLGLKPGDEVIVPTFSFFATAGVVARLGAVPVFVDVDERTFNINANQIEKKITKKTKGIMPVHLYGQIAWMDKIIELAKQYNLFVVEDAAQAIGSRYHGKLAGNFGNVSGFSCFPSKNLGAYGDAGFMTTNDDQLIDTLRRLCVHGAKPKYFHSMVGYNARLDTIQAAILLAKLNHLNEWHEARRNKAKIYDTELGNLPGVITPFVYEHNYHIYHQYTLIVENRQGLAALLKENEIGFESYYPLPLHLQECFKDLNYKIGDLPVSERLVEKVISLPIYPELPEDHQSFVIETIKGFYNRQ
jgi:dTDP-4-amino-4,6-dideoxygalactose transaminase